MSASARALWAWAAAVVVVLLTYGTALSHPFLESHDDALYIVHNPAVTDGWPAVTAAWTRFHVGNWAPLHILSYALDHALFGLRPSAFVLENLLLHAVNTVLLAGLVERLGAGRLAAAVAALAFAVHPVQVESAVWISQRKNVLAMAFFLAAIHLYLAYRAGARWRWYGLSLAAAAAALLTKSVAVVLPLALVAVDIALDRRLPTARRLADKVPYLALAAAAAVVAFVSQSPEAGGGRVAYHGGGPFATFLTMTTVVPRYLGLLVWPASLSAEYAPTIRTGLDGAVAGGVALLVALAAAGVLLLRSSPRRFAWYALFFLGLLPVLQIVPLVTLMNDRYLYFPMLGAAALAGEAVALAMARLGRAGRRALAGATVAAIVLLGARAHARVRVWRSDVALWSDAVAREPRGKKAWFNFGRALEASRAYPEALAAYERALALDPRESDALVNAAAMHVTLGSPREAEGLLERAVALPAPPYEAWFNLALVRYQLGDLDAADEPLAAAIALEPTWCQGHRLRVELLRRRGGEALAKDARRLAQSLGCSGDSPR